MHFSKKDLQDPSTIDKILKKKENFESALKFTNYVMLVATVAGDIILSIAANKKFDLKKAEFPIAGANLLFGFLEVGFAKIIGRAVESLPQKDYNKNINKYKAQVKDLINKMEKAKEKDPDKADEYQKIIDNCKNVLAEFERRKAKEASDRFKGWVEECKNLYSYLCSWKKSVNTIGHSANGDTFEMFQIASEYEIPEQDIINWAITHGDRVPCKDFQEEINPDINFCKDFNNSDIIWFSNDDEYNTFIVCNNRKFYSTDCRSYKQDSIYKEAEHYGKFDKDVLIEFDKEMGFYQFSDCPDNVKKKEFISFKK